MLRPAFLDACAAELAALAAEVEDVVGDRRLSRARWRHARYNAVAVLRDGRVAAIYRKQRLPNYTVFDEERYFAPGTAPCVFDVDGVRCGVIICEDCWFAEPARAGARGGRRAGHRAQRLAVSHAAAGARASRRSTRAHARRGVPFVYVNRVGGQDELVFDGASFVMDADGAIAQQLPAWHETVAIADFDGATPRPRARRARPRRSSRNVYQALVMGVRDYVGKNGFPGVLLGLSGGVDSALTLAVAVDALGRDRVRAVMMPSPYTASISLEDARDDGRPSSACATTRSRSSPMFDAFLRLARAASSRASRRTRPRRTSRRASAARC